MEDFAREIKAGSALFLLYGDEAVGKSRLLKELTQTRLSEFRVHAIELKSSDLDGQGSQDRSAEIEIIFVRAQQGDIIIADHFESALKKTRHQLFLSWATDGADKQLNLIISSNTEGFNELRQLSSQYQARIQSFQLMPYSSDEIEAFLGFHLFPNHPIGKLLIPAPIRKQLANTRGIVGNVIDIADRDGSQIETAPLTETESIRQGSWVIVTVLTLFAVAVGIGWYVFSGPDRFETAASDPGQTIIEEPQVTAQSEPETLSESELEIEPEAEAVIASEVEPEPEVKAEAAPESEVATETEPEVKAETAPESESEVKSEVEPESEPGTVPESEAIVSEAILEDQTTTESSMNNAITQQPLTEPKRLQRQLKDSLDWINSRVDSVGTIQIMTLSYGKFDTQSYYKYVAGLKNDQVDTSRIRVFKTYTNNTVVYSMVYGEYETRRDAGKAIRGLPEVLRKTSPIPRSVGGLREEIRRLEVEN